MRKKTGLYTKIITVVTLSLSFVIVLLLCFIYDGLKGALHNQLNERGNEIGSYIATLGNEDIILDNDYSLLQLINKVKASNSDVRYIIVADYRGRIIAHTFGSDYPNNLPRSIKPFSGGEKVESLSSNEGDIQQVTLPIDNGKIGFVSVGLSYHSMDNFLMTIISQFIAIGTIITVLAALVTGFLLLKILAPIRFLSLAAEKIKNNNYNVKVYYQGDDELGQLTQTFNEMAQDLEKKDIYNRRLLRELQEKEHSRDILIHKLFTAQEDERKRISRELHDGIGQSITSILAYLRLLLNNESNPTQKKLINSTRTIITSVLEELREMVVNLRPPSLDDIDIVKVFRQQVFDTAKMNGLIAEFEADEAISRLKLTDNQRLALYRILQESLTNIVHHAHAINIAVHLKLLPNKDIEMAIKDDGCGLSTDILQTAKEKRHLGLYGMQERVELLSGTLKIISHPGRGTTLRILMPTERRKKKHEED